MPDSPLERAAARNVMESCTHKLQPLFYRMMVHPEHVAAISAMLIAELKEIDRQLQESRVKYGGPYWFGPQFTLVDIAYFPFLDRSGYFYDCMF